MRALLKSLCAIGMVTAAASAEEVPRVRRTNGHHRYATGNRHEG